MCTLLTRHSKKDWVTARRFYLLKASRDGRVVGRGETSANECNRMSPSVSASVAQTAKDALNAKSSALSVGYKPMQPLAEVYGKLLGRVNTALAEDNDATDTKRDHKNHGKKRSPFRRQTPLVNAGYAARMAAVSHIVGRFVQAHHGDLRRADAGGAGSVKDHNSISQPWPINIVLVGCGLEMLGFWASALSLCPSLVCIYEIDCDEICQLKRRPLIETGLITGAERQRPGSAVVLSGATNFYALKPSQNQKKKTEDGDIPAGGSHYSLVSADLRNVFSVRRALQEAKFDNVYPTIVISDLVMAYLGQSYADEFLHYVASEICLCKKSMFFAYEPMGSESSAPEHPSVLSDYVDDYCTKFREKLNRGRHDKDSEQGDADACDVIGYGGRDILSLFVRCGFDGPMGSCPALISASLACGGSMVAKEHFDEHADLAMHLHCYGTAVAFSCGTDNIFAHTICPWLKISSTTTLNCRPSDVSDTIQLKDGSRVDISPIKCKDQEEVRNIFQSTYEVLYDEYPAVRKLVKNSLKTDLSGRHSDLANGIKGSSAINERYGGNGGGFWVATAGRGRKVIGCIGIRPFASNNICGAALIRPQLPSTEQKSKQVRKYEVQRLLVDAEYRSRGIGKALMNFAENFLATTVAGADECRMVATTFSALEEANALYKSRNYDCVEEKMVGKMLMNTYEKVIIKSDT